MSKKHFAKISTLILGLTILLCLAILFSFGVSLQTRASTTNKDVTSQVELLGNPFNKATYARNVWDMQVYSGRIYLGHGDYNSNAGPIPVIYYDPITNSFATQYNVNEEQIDKFKVLNGKLYIPGTDAKESWDYGNFYVMDNNEWTKFRTIPNANHVFDMAYYNGQLFATIGATTKDACGLLISKDMGKTWATVQNKFSTLNDWMSNLFIINDKLYATGDMNISSKGSYAKFRSMLVIDKEKVSTQVYDSSLFPKLITYHNLNVLKSTVFGKETVYLGVMVSGVTDQWSPEAMYAATDIHHARRIALPTVAALPTDILVRDDIIYVSAYVKNSINNYTNFVYKSDDLQNWTELFKFKTDTFVRSFEESKGDFYFGLGCDMTVLPASTGNILKVRKTAY